MRLKIPKLIKQIGTVLLCFIIIYAAAVYKEGFDDYLDTLKAMRGYFVPPPPKIDQAKKQSTYLANQTTCPDGTQKSEHVAGDCKQDLVKPYTVIPNMKLQNVFRATQVADGQQCYFDKDCHSGNCYNFRCLPPSS